MKTIQLKDNEEFNAVIAGLRAFQFLLNEWLMMRTTTSEPIVLQISGPRVKDLIELAEDSGDRLTIEQINGLVYRINCSIELCKSCGVEIDPATNLGFDTCADCAKIQDSLDWEARLRDKGYKLTREEGHWMSGDDGHWNEREDWE